MLMRALAGIGFIVAAVGCFAAMDLVTKSIALAVPVAMALAMRNALQTAVLGSLLLPSRGRALFRTRRPWLAFVRGALLLGCSVTAYAAVQVMPLAEFTAIVLLTPLALTAVAAVTERRAIGIVQWTLVAGGAAGALLVVVPADGMTATGGVALPLAVVGVNTAYQWVTSQLAQGEDAGAMQMWAGATGFALTAAALPAAWTPLPLGTWALLGVLAALATLGHTLLLHAYRRAPVAVLTPYLYLQIAYATLGGWLVFSQVPQARSLAGIALIAACGAAGTWRAARRPAG